MNHTLTAAAAIAIVLSCASAASAQCAPGVPPGLQDGYQLYDGPFHEQYYYAPYRYRRLPSIHQRPEQPRLRYFQHLHPWSDYEHMRKQYPHSYAGQYGLPPRPNGPTLRFYQRPALSPYSRYHHLDALFGDAEEQPALPDSEEYESGVMRDVPLRLEPAPAEAAAPQADPGLVLHRLETRAPAREDGTLSNDERRAWLMLGRDRVVRAERAFSSMALAHPSHGRPKAGFALARAAQGDHGAAVWTMRRAVKTAPHALDALPADEKLETTIRTLLAQYAGGDDLGLSAADTHFMCAALHYLLGEMEPARQSIRAAIEVGDRDRSAPLLLHATISGPEPAPQEDGDREVVPAAPPEPLRPDLVV